MSEDEPAVPLVRARLMGRVRQKNSAPELLVRSALHRAGFRFRLHRRDLPGTPDIVLPARSAAVFVHGCFWHRHPGCRRTTTPKTRADFWNAKFARNIERDAAAIAALEEQGWTPVVIWECEAGDAELVVSRVARSDAEVRRLPLSPPAEPGRDRGRPPPRGRAVAD
jgi:DNA mismatch endonuclease (patch repair protein)